MTEQRPSRPPGVPHGAWSGGHQPLEPSAGHAVVVTVTIALSAALVAGSAAASDSLITLLVLLLAVGALVVPAAVVGILWARARPRTRALLAGAAAACLLLLVWAVVRIAAVLPTVTFA
jgi:glucan phosphoethanolaminetransferase (alkaline phosphatase superfamily)